MEQVTHPQHYYLYQQLEHYRRRYNLTINELIELCVSYANENNLKLTASDMHGYLKSNTHPRPEKISILAQALNVNEVWLLGYEVPWGTKWFIDNVSKTYRTIRPVESFHLRLQQALRFAGYPLDNLNKTATEIREWQQAENYLVHIKLTRENIVQYINGDMRPRHNRLMLLAAALNVNEPWLLGYDVPRYRAVMQKWAELYHTRLNQQNEPLKNETVQFDYKPLDIDYFWKEVKRLANKQGLTLYELQKEIKEHQLAIYRKSKNSPLLEEAFMIAQRLNVPLEQLLKIKQ